MTLRPPVLRALFLVVLMAGGSGLAACTGGCGGGSKEKKVTRPANPRLAALVKRHAPPPPDENERGVIGAPKDETGFRFEPEPPSPEDEPPLLDGVPELPERIGASLAPYLDVRRHRFATLEPGGGRILVFSRQEEVTQLYALDRPRAPLRGLTSGTEPVEQAAFVPGDRQRLYFRRDLGGDEQFQIFRLDLADGRETLVSDGTSRHGVFRIAANGVLAFTSNRRNPSDMDVYVRPAGADGDPRRLIEREGQWIVSSWSRDSKELIVRQYLSAAESRLFLADSVEGSVSPLLMEQEGVHRDGRFSPDGKTIYFSSDRDGDFVRLYAFDRKSQEVRPLTPDLTWDVEMFALSADGETLGVVVNEDGASRLHLVDRRGKKRRRIESLPDGVISSLQFLPKRDAVVLTLSTAVAPADVFVLDLKTGALEPWSETRLEPLDGSSFVTPSLVRVPSFDALEVPAYYYRPVGDGPFPVLIWVHGGPEDQHRPTFDPIIQYFVQRGIAVLAPNVRGSDGYGRRYRSLDDGDKRLDAVKDIGALLDWIAAQPELDEARVGIHGASYGGYMVLASLVELGERIVAGSNVVGISNFLTFLEGTAAHRRDQRRAEYGDERDPDMREYLRQISPVTSAERIRSALLVAHGANDPRVPLEEADQIVGAVRSHGNDVWYMVARDEGHGFRKRKSRDLFYAVMVAFFERHLLAPPAADAAPAAQESGSAGEPGSVEQPPGAGEPASGETTGDPASGDSTDPGSDDATDR